MAVGQTGVVIVAAGSGSRMSASENKIFLDMGGEAVIERSVKTFQSHPAIDSIVLVGKETELERLKALFPKGKEWAKLLRIIPGGKERQDSVAAGLAAFEKDSPKYVLVHDGARPLCKQEIISRVVKGLDSHEAVVPGISINDTLRREIAGKTSVFERKGMIRSQTPQGFWFDELLAAHHLAKTENWSSTDDAQLMEKKGFSVHIVEGDEVNIKITNDRDLILASALLGILTD